MIKSKADVVMVECLAVCGTKARGKPLTPKPELIDSAIEYIHRLERHAPHWEPVDAIGDDWEGVCWIKYKDKVLLAVKEGAAYHPHRGGCFYHKAHISFVMRLDKPETPDET